MSGRQKFIKEKDEDSIDLEIDDFEEYLYIESIANLFNEIILLMLLKLMTQMI